MCIVGRGKQDPGPPDGDEEGYDLQSNNDGVVHVYCRSR